MEPDKQPPRPPGGLPCTDHAGLPYTPDPDAPFCPYCFMDELFGYKEIHAQEEKR